MSIEANLFSLETIIHNGLHGVYMDLIYSCVYRSFASVDGIFCLFEGSLSNLPVLRQEYGLAKNITEVMVIIEAYRTLRDRGPFPADKVVADLDGQFVFILYDSTNRNVFAAVVRAFL
jgi:asparagine synthetase B (glutamine-hydrolysing)